MEQSNVEKFFALYNADSGLRARARQAEECYPGSLEMREGVVEFALLPLADEMGLPFTVKELRLYETCEKMKRSRDVPITEDDPEDLPEFWLIDRGWDLEDGIFN